MITLGGKIFLEGFEELAPAEVLVVKKLVGSYVREACQYEDRCSSVRLVLSKKEQEFSLWVGAFVGDAETVHTEVQGKNIFMTLDRALKSLLRSLANK